MERHEQMETAEGESKQSRGLSMNENDLRRTIDAYKCLIADFMQENAELREKNEHLERALASRGTVSQKKRLSPTLFAKPEDLDEKSR